MPPRSAQFPLVGRLRRYLAGRFSSFLPVRAGPEWHSWHSRTPRLKPEKKKRERKSRRMPVLRNCQLYTYHSVIYPRAARHRPDNPVSSDRLIIESAHSDRDLRLGTPVGTPSSAVCAHRYRPIYLAYSLSTRSIHLSIYFVYTLYMHIFRISASYSTYDTSHQYTRLYTMLCSLLRTQASNANQQTFHRRSRKLTGSGQSCSFPGLSLRRFRPAVRIFFCWVGMPGIYRVYLFFLF